MNRIDVVKGDITQRHVRAVANAANISLLRGDGVDGAIHCSAGPGLMCECGILGGCAIGDARVTGGYGLPARWVTHTVGPVWSGGANGERELVASCYRRCLDLTVLHSVRNSGFPAISTGAYEFPVYEATYITVTEVASFLESNSNMGRVVFVCFSDEATDDCEAGITQLELDGELVRNG